MLSFCVCALFSGFWFGRWAKIYVSNIGLAGEERIWPGLGWFSGLMFVGSVAGAVAWGALMQSNILYYEPSASSQQQYSLNASLYRWFAAFNVLYGLEFLCFIIPKLMMLGRLTENTTGSSRAHAVDMDRVRRWWHGAGPDGLRRRALPMVFTVMAAAVVLCSVTAMIALDRAAAYNTQAADVFDRASAACGTSGNDTDTSLKLHNEASNMDTIAYTALSVQSVCEAVALIMTALSYLLLVVFNVAVYRRAERVATTALLSVSDSNECGSVSVPAVFADAGYAGSADTSVQLARSSATDVLVRTQKAAVEQRWRLIAACVVVLVSFPARAAFDLLNAYSQFSDPYNPACGQCDPCQSQQYLIQTWIAYTPQFQPCVVALSSPLPMMWSLWLMMSAWERKHMRRGVDMNKTEEQRLTIAARARLGVDLPRPLLSVFFWNRT
jgi:hypothetical protein